MNTLDRGRREYEALIGRAPEHALAELRERSPELFETMLGASFGTTLARPELGRAERELATVALLAGAGDCGRQLATHVRAALRHGIDPSELRALCEHVAVYAGMPRALNAVAVVDDVLLDAGVPRPARQDRIRLADHETVVAQRGDTGPAVVLLHALGLDRRMWDQVMGPLAAGRRVYAYDIRGHGAAAGSPNPFTLADAAADLIAVMDALGLGAAHVVGLSYGGAIAQTAAVAHPERFSSLALLATTDVPFPAFRDRAASGLEDGMEAQVIPSLTRWFTPGALAAGGWGVRYARERVRRADPAYWAAAWRAFEGLDVAGRLEGFRPPVLLLTGELDASTTPEVMTAMSARIPQARYRELPATPHMQTLECPLLVAGALGAFLPEELSLAA
jgi:3-oxoadipate enol-lactonase